MTEYDFSPEAYDRYIQNQNRVANWVQHTEQHRQVFEAAVPGAPGVFPVPRRQSPPIPEHYTSPHRPSPVYPKPPIYHRAPASSSSSEDSYVHVAAPPQIHRLRPPPLPIYAPPRPPPAPLPAQPYSSPVVFRVDGDRLSSDSPRHRHIRSKSHSHPHHSPPPLVTPIYTSPPASHFIPPPPIIYMSFQGHPIPSRSRPVIRPREQYRKPPSPGAPNTHSRDQPPTPPTSPLRSPSSSDTPTSVYHVSSPNSPASLPFPPSPAPPAHTGPYTSGPGGSHSQAPPALRQEDQHQKHGQYHIQHYGYPSTSILPGLEPPYISRNLQQSGNSSQRLDYHRVHHHPYHDPSRRSSKSSSQSYSLSHPQSRHSPATLRPQPYPRYSDPSYERVNQPKSATTSTGPNGIISVSVPPIPRYPIDDRDLEYTRHQRSSHSSSRTRANQPVVHAPQPIRHPDMLSPRLRASTRA